MLSELSRKTVLVIAAVVIISAGSVLVILPDLLAVEKPTIAPAPEPVAEPEPAPEPEPETVELEEETKEEAVLEAEIILEPETVEQIIPELVIDPIPEPLDIEIVEDPVPVANIPEPPIIIPAPPNEIPEIPEKVIQNKVDRYNANLGTPIPEKNTAAGIISKIHSANMMEINGILVKLRDVDIPNESDSEQWREALMRICPVGSLALYDGANRTPNSQGVILANVWCYGYPNAPPLASTNEVMTETDYDIIGRGCSASNDTRLLGCTR